LMEHEDNGMMEIFRVLAPRNVEVEQRAEADHAPEPTGWPICSAADTSGESAP
jgi:hypothetical protein